MQGGGSLAEMSLRPRRRRHPMSYRSVLLACAATLALAAPPHACEPIEGTWNFQGGQVLVEPPGSGAFKGTATAPTKFPDCPHPKGEQIWSIAGSGHDYTGAHLWYASDCSVKSSRPA